MEFLKFYRKLVTIILVFLLIILMLPQLLGYKPYAIKSNSMKPTLETGSVVYIKPVSTINDLKISDVITFHYGSVIETHRIISIDTINNEITTRGDALKTNDVNKTSFKSVIGVAQFSFPFLGYCLLFFQSLIGLITAILLLLLFSVSLILPELKRGGYKNEQSKENQ